MNIKFKKIVENKTYNKLIVFFLQDFPEIFYIYVYLFKSLSLPSFNDKVENSLNIKLNKIPNSNVIVKKHR